MARSLSPTVSKRRLAYELRRLREAAGLTIEDVGAKLECSASKISRIETMRVGITPRDARDLVELYQVSPQQQEELVQLARDARRKGWWQAYGDVVTSPFLGLEAEAGSLRTDKALVMPGLLQTEGYVRALISECVPEMPEGEVERRVAVRMARKALLDGEDPPTVWVVLDEAALRRPVGGADGLRGQLKYLLEVAERPYVTLQVIPFDRGSYAGMGGAFAIVGFSDPADSDVVYVESARNSAFLEDQNDIEHYRARFEEMTEIALAPGESKQFITTVWRGQ